MVACTCMSNIMCIVGPIAACVSDWLTADSDICVYVYDIMDTSAM